MSLMVFVLGASGPAIALKDSEPQSFSAPATVATASSPVSFPEAAALLRPSQRPAELNLSNT